MSGSDLPVEAGGAMVPSTSMIERTTGAVAILGGCIALAVALLATVSVLGRYLFASPVSGDFEYVKMATAVAVFAYLPYAQARRGNIMVDTFTSWLPKRVTTWIDAFWDLSYAALMGYIGYCLINGTTDAIKSGETTMMTQVALWPSIMLSTALCLFVALTAVVTAVRLVRGLGVQS